MGMECGECEHDLRGGHAPSCSRYILELCPVCSRRLRDGDGYMFCPSHGEVAPREFIPRATHDRLIAEAVAAERERIPPLLELLIEASPPYVEFSGPWHDWHHKLATILAPFKDEVEAIAAIRGNHDTV